MIVQTEEDLEKLKQIGKVVAETIQLMGKSIKPGITTKELDEIGRKHLTSYGAHSAPELMYNFPGATCISVNNEIAHGIPGNRKIQSGDIVNIDVSAELEGYYADTGFTFLVEPYSERQEFICKVSQEALKEAIKVVKAGAPLNIIGQTIENTAKKYKCSIILNLGSHGIGKSLHEEPLYIAPYNDKDEKRILKEGMVITIEPFISSGAWEAEESEDGWTLKTAPQFITAQYEHTLVVTKTGALILTRV